MELFIPEKSAYDRFLDDKLLKILVDENFPNYGLFYSNHFLQK